MSDLPKHDKWGTGAAYEPYVGRWSRRVAPEFLNWLNIPPHVRWLDVGCGTGALTEAILRWANPLEVTSVDRSEGFIAFAHEQIVDPRVHFEVSDAQSLPVENNHYDVAVAGLALNFIPDQPAALREIARTVRPEGVIAAYVWDYADKMQMMRYFWDAAVALRPEATIVDESRRFLICQPEPLATLFQQSGLGQVEVHQIDIPTHFQNFDDYWTPFLGGQGSAPTYVASLNEMERDQLRDYLHTHLPINADGSIDLIARAWAVRGVR